MAAVAGRAPVVLIVEDDEAIASALHDALEEEGIHAVVSSTVANATRQARVSHPSLVLLDWTLPDGTGEDVVRAIRPHDPSVPIIVISAAQKSLTESQRVDASERVAKPFDLDWLIGLVRRYLI